MEERSLRVYTDKTFFTRITNTITKILVPTKIGINGMLISMKRNNVVKAYEAFIASEDIEDAEKKQVIEKKYEDTYSLYLEAIDKHIMDSIYKKVKNETATEFEKNALSRYYEVIHLKEKEYVEYKHVKQRFLLELDYETVEVLDKQKIMDKFLPFYISKMDSLYKGLLKYYSIKLADNLTYQNKEEVYEKIFIRLEEYITKVLPLKIKVDTNDVYKEILDEYDRFENYTVGKLDQNDNIEKRMLLLAISRRLFTHSLPLIVAEQCYAKLLRDTRSLIVDTKVAKKREKAYSLLIHLIEDYNVRLLSTKIYWDKPEKRDEYKKFWSKYQEIQTIKETNQEEYNRKKEILFIRSELKEVYLDENKYFKLIKFYKSKLVEFGEMRQFKNNFISDGSYTGKIDERVSICKD